MDGSVSDGAALDGTTGGRPLPTDGSRSDGGGTGRGDGDTVDGVTVNSGGYVAGGGCRCDTGTGRHSPAGLSLLALAVLGMVRRRARRRR